MWVRGMDQLRALSTCAVDLSDKLPFEGWLMLGWILALSNRVIEVVRKIEAEEKGGEGVGVRRR